MPTLMESFWLDGAAGLPIHPLAVHLVVVLVPLAGLALVAQTLVPRLRDRYLGVTLLALAAGVVAAFVAEKSGEALAQREGFPNPHALLGHFVPWTAAALLAVGGVWWWLGRRTPTRTPALVTVTVLTAVLGVATAGLSVVVGHTGAEAVWGTPPSRTPATAPAPTAAPATPISLATVAKHADADSCWVAIDGDAYDLTDWVARHPGGRDRILRLCGTDATAAFQGQHLGAAKPAAALAGFKIGPIG